MALDAIFQYPESYWTAVKRAVSSPVVAGAQKFREEKTGNLDVSRTDQSACAITNTFLFKHLIEGIAAQ